jgi:hypothetical protein
VYFLLHIFNQSIKNRKGDSIMVQVEVTVSFEGKSYLTNVIANRETSDDVIQQLALEQVQKQWKK